MRRASTITGALYAGLALVAVLFSYEIAHFWTSTDAALKDEQYVAWRYSHVGCKAHPEEPADFTCPITGYNWIEVECWTAACTYRDPNAITMTDQRQKKQEDDLRNDLKASLQTVGLVSQKDAKKALSDAEIWEDNEIAGNLDRAGELMHAREMKRFHDLAEEMARRR